jgi:hypothetical protein
VYWNCRALYSVASLASQDLCGVALFPWPLWEMMKISVVLREILAVDGDVLNQTEMKINLKHVIWAFKSEVLRIGERHLRRKQVILYCMNDRHDCPYRGVCCTVQSRGQANIPEVIQDYCTVGVSKEILLKAGLPISICTSCAAQILQKDASKFRRWTDHDAQDPR